MVHVHWSESKRARVLTPALQIWAVADSMLVVLRCALLSYISMYGEIL